MDFLPNSIKASLGRMKLLLSHEFLKQSSKLKTKKKTPAKNAKLMTFGIKEAQNTVYIEEKNQSIEIGLEIIRMIELVDNNIVTVATVPNVQKT